jgi:hypothetical protein
MQMNVKVICFRVERIFKRAEIAFDVFLKFFPSFEFSKSVFQLHQTAVERRRVLHRQSEKAQPSLMSSHRFGNFRFRLSA